MIDFASHGLIAPATPPRDPGGPADFSELLQPLLVDRQNEVILVGRSGRLTVAEVEATSNRYANALGAIGVAAGDRVATALPNDLPVVLSFLGAMKLGAIWVGVNRGLAGPEKAHLLADSGAAVLVCDADTAAQTADLDLPLRHTVVVDPYGDRDSLGPIFDAAPDTPPGLALDPYAPAAIAYTSGTTGRPKGAVHSQHNILLPGKVAALRADTGDLAGGQVLGAALPLTILNMQILGPVSAFLRGQRLVAVDRVDAVGLARWIATEGIETFHAVPTMVHDLLTDPAVDPAMLDTVKGVRVGGAALPDAFRKLYTERFGERVGAGYGLTENPTSVTGEDINEPAVAGGSGRALPQMQVHIVDADGSELEPGEVGEICVGPATSGPFADVYRPMLGYWNLPDESQTALAGGLLHTGDVGALDESGCLFVKDRRSDLILRGGANVYPAEVERVLHLDPRVAACAVVGQPDPRLGQRVVAFVQLAGERPDPAELVDLCRRNLARYKVPDRIQFVDSFPRTPMGKIRKTELLSETYRRNLPE